MTIANIEMGLNGRKLRRRLDVDALTAFYVFVAGYAVVVAAMIAAI